MAMMRVLVATAAGLAASGASAKGINSGIAKELAVEALERKHALTNRHQKGNENNGRRTTKKVLTDEQKEGIQTRMLKRTRGPAEDSKMRSEPADDEVEPLSPSSSTSGTSTKTTRTREDRGGKKMRGGSEEELLSSEGTLFAGFVLGGAGKPGKASPAKAPSNGPGGSTPLSSPSSPSSSSSSSSSRGKTVKGGSSSSSDGKSGKGSDGKSRKISSGICTKRLGIAYTQIRALGDDSIFGTVRSPSDVTDLCSFSPPENEDDDPNFGCPFFYAPITGFLDGEEEYIVNFGEDPGLAFNSLALYCQCYQGYELGCASKVPHGPPSSTVEYETKTVNANGFSEYIPFGSPSERAEYCKMVGVWNGDFDGDIAEDFTEDVTECGCYFTGQAREMVDQCPGVELGAFFEFPDASTMPTPLTTDVPTSVPTAPVTELEECPEGATFCDGFENATFPEGGGWSVETTVEEDPDATASLLSAQVGYDIGGLLRGVFDNRARKLEEGRGLQEDDDDEELPVWELSTEEAFEGEYSIKSPDVGEFEDVIVIADATLSVGSWETPGILTFSLLTEFDNTDERFNGVAWFVDDEYINLVNETIDWTKYEINLAFDAEEVTWQYAHVVAGAEESKAAYIDDIYFVPYGIPTYIPTYSPTGDSTSGP